jgi:hypothetical protein
MPFLRGQLRVVPWLLASRQNEQVEVQGLALKHHDHRRLTRNVCALLEASRVVAGRARFR